jgi:hypothetical protein
MGSSDPRRRSALAPYLGSGLDLAGPHPGTQDEANANGGRGAQRHRAALARTSPPGGAFRPRRNVVAHASWGDKGSRTGCGFILRENALQRQNARRERVTVSVYGIAQQPYERGGFSSDRSKCMTCR